MKSALPLDIPPRGSVLISCTLEVFDKEETFDYYVVVYLDEDSGEIQILVRRADGSLAVIEPIVP